MYSFSCCSLLILDILWKTWIFFGKHLLFSSFFQPKIIQFLCLVKICFGQNCKSWLMKGSFKSRDQCRESHSQVQINEGCYLKQTVLSLTKKILFTVSLSGQNLLRSKFIGPDQWRGSFRNPDQWRGLPDRSDETRYPSPRIGREKKGSSRGQKVSAVFQLLVINWPVKRTQGKER